MALDDDDIWHEDLEFHVAKCGKMGDMWHLSSSDTWKLCAGGK